VAISNKVLFANVRLESSADITARHIAAVVSVVSAHPETSSAYKKRLSDLPGLSHLTIEVERCPSAHGLCNNDAFRLSALTRTAQGITFGPWEYANKSSEAMSSDSHSRLSLPSA
jgi:hypothetical protein